MHDWTADTRNGHERDGGSDRFASRTGFGAGAAPLVIDFVSGFSEPGHGLGKGFSQERGAVVR